MTPRAQLWIATVLGIGYLPIAPGTWASLAVVTLVGFLTLLVNDTSTFLLLGFFGVTFLGTWAANSVVSDLGDSDPSQVVIDEVAGQLLTLLFVPLTFWTLCVGFVLFRVFDVTKIPPVRQAEKLAGGYGIMMDDVVAGIYSGIVLVLLRWFGAFI